MDKGKELEFLGALYMLQKASDLGDISMDEAYDKVYCMVKNEQKVQSMFDAYHAYDC